MEQRRLIAIRKRWELTQARLAKLFAVSGPLIVSQWENGFRNPGGLAKKIYLLLEQLPKKDGQKLLDWLDKAEQETRDSKKPHGRKKEKGRA